VGDDEMKEINKMIGTIMKETGFNYEFIVNGLSLNDFEALYLECSREELVSKKQETDKLITKLKTNLVAITILLLRLYVMMRQGKW
jgi:hypothetical protein